MRKNILLLAAVLSSATLLFGQNASGHELMGSGNSGITVQSSDTVPPMNATDQDSQTRSESMRAFDTSRRAEAPVDYSKNPYWAPQDLGYIESNTSGN